MSAFTIDVNPKVLVWARAEMGLDVREVAEYLKVDPDTVEDWEQHGSGIKYADLKRLASFYKRQVPVFFLQTAPAPIKKPQDFRNLSAKERNLHKDTMLAVRRTRRYLELYRQSATTSEVTAQYKWLTDARHAKDTAIYLREVLDAPIITQHEFAHENFKFWRKRIEEKLNIFVFQFPITSQEFDGFSYIEDGKPYAITLNSQISDNRKVFTLFHELGHILEGESGLCFTRIMQAPVIGKEAKCNHFAAEFLMPANEIIPPISFDELKRNAKSLGVSAHAYLIRCNTLGVIGQDDYEKYLGLIRKQTKKAKPKQTGGPTQLLVTKSQRGDKFFDFVLSAYQNKTVSASIVRDVLNLKVVGLGRRET